ncbi:hypothetical protein A3K73_00930 [Candidatus Pacearchaeota archaeon RBG_13_36_9]|nr:MAG: hypothetical protein A3K73_00930 [Candidatus Pacearchaeota archaeon RBG_13_36_9]
MHIKEIVGGLLKDRSYLDWWSAVHFIFGVLFGLILKNIGLIFITSVFVTLSLFTFWEIIEPMIFKHIIGKRFKEIPINQIMDIIYGFAGFLVYWFFIV